MQKRLILPISLLMLAACSRTENKSEAVRQDSVGPAAMEQQSLPEISAPEGNVITLKDATLARDDNKNETYKYLPENSFQDATVEPLSTFSIDVDAAAYSNVRRYLTQGIMPPSDAVRVEELINYFDYDYPDPQGDVPFSITTEAAPCPWNTAHQLVHIGLQGKRQNMQDLPPGNLVFLLDVSGSMEDADKLPLVKRALDMLVEELRPQDKVSIVVYAGAAGTVLEPTGGDQKKKIRAALENLMAGGSTAGGEGIEKAYALAKANFRKEGNNRVILCTDGDFNVGVSSEGELTRLIEQKRKEGIYLSVLGFGTGNIKDNNMEALADKGNGNYAYIDNLAEARKVLVKEAGGTLMALAKDVKLQVEFNPALVKSYRLVGYENRVLQTQDFEDDKKDAGELGAGHNVTALYEIELRKAGDVPGKNLKYQSRILQPGAAVSPELATLSLRYKKPNEEVSRLLSQPILRSDKTLSAASENFRFSAAVAEWGMLLRESAYVGKGNYAQALELATRAKGEDTEGYRAEFLTLVKNSRDLARAAGNANASEDK